MKINFQVPTSSPISQREERQELLRSYSISYGRKIEILFDPLSGAKAMIQEENEKRELDFENSGIPMQLRFSLSRLKRYLEDTYASYNGQRVLLHLRLRGGHSSHSSHSTHTYTPPPPPKRTPINYSAGYKITHLTRPEVRGGEFVEESGGAGFRNYSVFFQTHDASLRPLVTIKVDKSEYHAAEIQKVESAKAETLSEISAKTQEGSRLQSEITKMEGLKEKHLAEQLQKREEFALIETDEEELRSYEEQYLRWKEALKKIRGNVRSLLAFLDLSTTYNIGLDLRSGLLETFLRNKSVILEQIALIPEGSSKGKPSRKLLIEKCTASSNTIWLEKSRQSLGKDIIAVIGNTGVGKSTVVNYLLGSKIVYDKGSKTMRVAEGCREFARIGHRGSETLFTEIHQNSRFAFADCGGFLDTREPEIEFQTMASLKATLSNAATVRFLLCFDSNNLQADRFVHFSSFVRKILQELIRNYGDVSRSLMLMFTKPFRHGDGSFFSGEDAYHDIRRAMRDIQDSDLQKLYEFLSRDGGKYICVCDPKNESAREPVLKTLSHMARVKVEIFSISCSPRLQKDVMEEIDAIARQANDLYDIFLRISSEIDRLSARKGQRETLTNRLQQLQTDIEGLASEVSRVEGVRQRVLGELSQLQNRRREQENKIRDLRSGFVTYQSDGGAWRISSNR